MTQSTDHFRIFVSSTFTDLAREREALVRSLFPKLKHECRSRGVRFTDVDLRWGITDEDSARGKVITTCLEEIDLCFPNIVVVLGERYGWLPDHHEVYRDVVLLEKYPWVEDAVLEGSSLLDIEVQHALLNRPGISPEILVFAKDTPCDEKLTALKHRIEAKGYTIFPFSSREEMLQEAERHLLQVVRSKYSDKLPVDPSERLRAIHRKYGESFIEAYVANPENVQRLDAYSQDTMGRALIVKGESGIGKTSLAAYWMSRKRLREADSIFVEHYVGAEPDSSSIPALIQRLIHELAPIAGFEIESSELKSEVELRSDLARVFSSLKDKNIYVVLDGIDRLNFQRPDFGWLPHNFPPNVRVILSLSDEACYLTLEERGYSVLDLKRLTLAEIRSLTIRYLGRFHKALGVAELQLVLEHTEASNPLFLRLLLEELRLTATHDLLPQILRKHLNGQSIEDLASVILHRIEDDFSRSTIESVLTYLWASKTGLSAAEIGKLSGIGEERLRDVLIALEGFYSLSGGLIALQGNRIRSVVERRYLNLTSEKRVRNQLIELAAGFHDPTRHIQEKSCQLIHLAAEDKLVSWITDPEFVIQSVLAGSLPSLLSLWASLQSAGQSPTVLKQLSANLQECVFIDPKVAIGILDFLGSLGDYASLVSLRPNMHVDRSDLTSLLRLDSEYAVALIKLERYEEARSLLASYANNSEVEGLQLATILHRLGYVNFCLRNSQTAVAALEQAITTCEEAKASSVVIAEIYGDLAAIEQFEGMTSRARDLGLLALQHLEMAGGYYNPLSLNTCNNLASIYRALGEIDNAIRFARRAFDIGVYQYGYTNLDTLIAMRGLVILLRIAKRISEALPLAEQLIRLTPVALGEKHEITISSQLTYARLLLEAENFPEAVETASYGYALAKDRYGEEDDRTKDSALVLARAYRATGEDALAATLYRPALSLLMRMPSTSLREKETEIESLLAWTKAKDLQDLGREIETMWAEFRAAKQTS